MLRQRGLTVATMESCSGGLLVATITDVPGCGDFFRGGLVAYAIDIKTQSGVPELTIEQHGVESAEAARAMAETARQKLGADIGIGITGVAGPKPQDGLPLGLMFIALEAGELMPSRVQMLESGSHDLKTNKALVVAEALRLLSQAISTQA
jgi:PncC family amidohydrolase